MGGKTFHLRQLFTRSLRALSPVRAVRGFQAEISGLNAFGPPWRKVPVGPPGVGGWWSYAWCNQVLPRSLSCLTKPGSVEE